MTTQTLRFLTGSVFALSLVVCGAPWGTSQVAWAQNQSLFVAYTDSEGAPFTDMEAKNVIIQWDEVECEIVELEPINWPVRVTLMVDTATGSVPFQPDMRAGIRLFLDALSPDIEVAISTIGGRPQRLIEHTSNREELSDAVGRIASAGGASTFFDGLYEEAKNVADDRDREYFPVVVMVAVGGAEGSSRYRGKATQETMDRLNASGGAVHTLLLTGLSGPGERSAGRAAQAQWGSDFAVASRGSYEPIADPSLFRTRLPELAEKLSRKHTLVSNQYRVTYKPPRGASDQPRIQMSTTRIGLTMLATDNGNIQQ